MILGLDRSSIDSKRKNLFFKRTVALIVVEAQHCSQTRKSRILALASKNINETRKQCREKVSSLSKVAVVKSATVGQTNLENLFFYNLSLFIGLPQLC